MKRRLGHNRLRIFFATVTAVVLTVAVPALSSAARADSIPESRDVIELSSSDMNGTDHTIYLTDTWLFRAGDSLQWAEPGWDDTGWQQVSTLLGPSDLPFVDWQGIGWFRLHLNVDSTLVGRPLAIVMTKHNGASELYLDGKKQFAMGRIAGNGAMEKAYTDHVPHIISFSNAGRHVLAVRYANPNAAEFNELGFTGGFRMHLANPERQMADASSFIRTASFQQMLFSGALLAFTLIHLMLYFFYTADKNNLYFALFTGFLCILSYSEYQLQLTHAPLLSVSYYRFSIIAWMLAIIFALRFSYNLAHERVPRQYWLFLAIGVVLALVTWFVPQATTWSRQLFVGVTILEMLRVLAVSLYKKREGIWIIGAGLGLFILGILYSVSVNLELIPGNASLGNSYGSGLLILAMSVYLARNFARTNRRLQQKLGEVRELSERALQQERINREKEIESKLLAAENERKTRELEEARTLQLSMLPRKLPDLPHWDIAVYMDTANEVGGDYYDFSRADDGTLTIALGDATGHGMKAGIMVATAKSYFHTLADEYDILEILRRMSSGIRNMDLKTMYMSLMLLKCNGHRLRLAMAGMPPALWYRSRQGDVEDIVLKAMPLGTGVDFPYKEHELEAAPGDVLLLMSDGLMELFNSKRELLGIGRVRRSLEEGAEGSAQDVLNRITRLAEQWAGDSREDDMTVMVLKAREAS